MSAEDDTFDIDIYGDEQQQDQQVEEEEDPEDRIDFGDDDFSNNETTELKQELSETKNGADQNQTSQAQPISQQGTKRKADEYESDNQPPAGAPTAPAAASTPSRPASHVGGQIEANAQCAMKLSDLHWWTTEDDLRAFAALAGVEEQLRDIAFGEHKINGKSRGEAYLEFATPTAAAATKKEIEAHDEPKEGETDGRRKNVFQCWYVMAGNPFKGRDSGQATKKDTGAYNAAPVRGGFNRGGGYQDRGRGNFQRGGGSFGGGRGGGYQNQYPNQGQAQQSFGMNNNMQGGMGFNNPMMAGMGYGNPMMGGMGAMGGMNGMGMGGYGMNMMAGRGNFQACGGGMMGRGGGGGFGGGGYQQGGGMQQGYGGGGGFQGGMQGGPPKRQREN